MAERCVHLHGRTHWRTGDDSIAGMRLPASIQRGTKTVGAASVKGSRMMRVRWLGGVRRCRWQSAAVVA